MDVQNFLFSSWLCSYKILGNVQNQANLEQTYTGNKLQVLVLKCKAAALDVSIFRCHMLRATNYLDSVSDEE